MTVEYAQGAGALRDPLPLDTTDPEWLAALAAFLNAL